MLPFQIFHQSIYLDKKHCAMLTFQCWNFTLQNFTSNVAHTQRREPCIFWCKKFRGKYCTIVTCLFQQFQATWYLPINYVEPSGLLSDSEEFCTILVNSVAIQFLKQLSIFEMWLYLTSLHVQFPGFSKQWSPQHVYAVLAFLTVSVLSIPLIWNSASDINCFIYLSQNDL